MLVQSPHGAIVRGIHQCKDRKFEKFVDLLCRRSIFVQRLQPLEARERLTILGRSRLGSRHLINPMLYGQCGEMTALKRQIAVVGRERMEVEKLEIERASGGARWTCSHAKSRSKRDLARRSAQIAPGFLDYSADLHPLTCRPWSHFRVACSSTSPPLFAPHKLACRFGQVISRVLRLRSSITLIGMKWFLSSHLGVLGNDHVSALILLRTRCLQTACPNIRQHGDRALPAAIVTR